MHLIQKEKEKMDVEASLLAIIVVPLGVFWISFFINNIIIVISSEPKELHRSSSNSFDLGTLFIYFIAGRPLQILKEPKIYDIVLLNT